MSDKKNGAILSYSQDELASTEELVNLLRQAAKDVEDGESLAGIIEWDGFKGRAPNGKLFVRYCIRLGNLGHSQGGWVEFPGPSR